MTGKLRKTVGIFLTLVLLVSVGMLLRQWIHNTASSGSYDSARQIAAAAPSEPIPAETVPPPESVEIPDSTAPQALWVPAPVEADEHMEALKSIDLSALQAVNPDVVAWIRIPDTNIDYPVLQGADNDYYLSHTWDKWENSAGSIFLEWQSSASLDDFNTLIYGHNMANGTMFAHLHRFGNQDFFNYHPYIYLVTGEGILRYEVFSSHDAGTDSSAYRLGFQQEGSREDFLADMLEASVIETGVQPETHDRILTLSTCTGMGYRSRWVVHARLKMTEIPAP